MTLRRRPIDPFRVVSIHDDGFDTLPDRVLKEYEDSDRNFEKIAPHIKEMKDPLTVFVCYPLRSSFDAMALTNSVPDLKAIFGAHVKEIENAGPGNEPKFVDKGDRVYLTTEYVDSIPPAIVIDVASEIVRKGMADSNPFSLPVGYWRARTRRNVKRLAAEALTAVPMNETV